MAGEVVNMSEFAQEKFHNFLRFIESKCEDSFQEVCRMTPINPFNVSGTFVLATIREVIPPIAPLITARDEDALLVHIPPAFVHLFNRERSKFSDEDIAKVWRYLDLWVELSHYF